MESNAEVLSTDKIQQSPDLYKMVDLFNRILKEEEPNSRRALDQVEQNKAIVTMNRT